METLNTLMAANGHDKKKVFYLKVGFLSSSNKTFMILTVLWWQLFFMKVDIEGSELTALPQWIESGALDKVGRITITLLKFLFNIE